MNSTELLARFRIDTRDFAVPPLWSDAEVYSFIDDAQKMFCRLTGGISDATSGAAKLHTRTGKGFASIDPVVLKIRSIYGVDGKALELLNFEDLELSGSGGKEIFSQDQGTVSKAVLGMDPNKVRLVLVPKVDAVFNMIIYRLPLDAITTGEQDLEVAEQHHLALLKWARHLAHLKTDAETYDRGRAQQFEQEFRAYCDQAKGEKERREHKYRQVQFSW